MKINFIIGHWLYDYEPFTSDAYCIIKGPIANQVVVALGCNFVPLFCITSNDVYARVIKYINEPNLLS